MNIRKATLDFIHEHRSDDVRSLALRGCHDKDVDLPFALDQIAGWQTARLKLPAWAATEGIIYPPHLNMEQCSSEQTARYKQFLIQNPKFKILIDLTGGFGVDFSFMTPHFDRAIYVERDERLCAIAQHNFSVLGLKNIEVVCQDGVDYLRDFKGAASPCPEGEGQGLVIYLDPSRRDVHGHRVYGIEDCTPNVLSLKDEMLAKADMVMIKLSPMLDWHDAARKMGEKGSLVHIVSMDNECKELLLILTHNDSPLRLICVNGDEHFECFPYDKAELRLDGCIDGKYLYVPNASIMKAGVYNQVSQAFGIAALGKSSHLFVADKYIRNFPGRKFIIHATTTMNKRELKEKLNGIGQANISVRNFPMTAADLRKRLRLKDGGDVYLFATTVCGKHIIFITSKD